MEILLGALISLFIGFAIVSNIQSVTKLIDIKYILMNLEGITYANRPYKSRRAKIRARKLSMMNRS